MKAILLALALSAPALTSPVPAARRISGVSIRYTANYPNPPSSSSPSSQAENDVLQHEDDEATSSTEPDLDDILSVEKPLPSSFLLAVPALREEAPHEPEEAPREPEEGAAEEPVVVEEEEEGRSEWVGGVRHICPFTALLAFSALGLLFCAVRRWREPRGSIFLHIETPKRESLSLKAEEESTDGEKPSA